MLKKVPIVEEQKVPPLVRRLMTMSDGCLRQDWPCLLLQASMFAANGIALNIASFLLLLGIIMVWCPCINLFPSLIIFDMQNLQFLGLGELLNAQTVDLYRDIQYLTQNFIDEIRVAGFTLFFFAVILYTISLVGCYATAMTSRKGIDFYTLFCSVILASLIFTSMFYLNQSRMENSELVDRVKCYLKKYYKPSLNKRSSMDDNFVDFFQSRLGCCGVINGSRYLETANPHKFPLSCCKLMRAHIEPDRPTFFETSSSCLKRPTVYNSNIQAGCIQRIYAYISDLVGRTIFLFWILNFMGLANCLVMKWSSKKVTEKENLENTI